MRAQVLAALEESLTATPDPADVWSGVQAGIDRRQRRNRYYRTGFAIALVLAVSLLAASISAQPRQHPPTGIPVGEWKNSIHPTWLPDGFVAQRFTATLAVESITYRARYFELHIGVSNTNPVQSRDPRSGQDVQINGRPGHERSDSGQTMLAFQLASGRWATVTLSDIRPDVTDAQPAVRDLALRMANSLEDNGDLRLSTKFAPTYLPPGQHIIGVESNIFTPAGFGSIVCATGIAERGLYISISNVAINKDRNATVRIADIQGRPAYRSVSGATVFVADFHGGTLSVGVTSQSELGFPDSGPGIVPLDELIKIAEGIRWVG